MKTRIAIILALAACSANAWPPYGHVPNNRPFGVVQTPRKAQAGPSQADMDAQEAVQEANARKADLKMRPWKADPEWIAHAGRVAQLDGIIRKNATEFKLLTEAGAGQTERAATLRKWNASATATRAKDAAEMARIEATYKLAEFKAKQEKGN